MSSGTYPPPLCTKSRPPDGPLGITGDLRWILQDDDHTSTAHVGAEFCGVSVWMGEGFLGFLGGDLQWTWAGVDCLWIGFHIYNMYWYLYLFIYLFIYICRFLMDTHFWWWCFFVWVFSFASSVNCNGYVILGIVFRFHCCWVFREMHSRNEAYS